MPAQEERDSNGGVPFLVAPVKSEDPKRSDDKPKAVDAGKTDKKDEAAAESDELVSARFLARCRNLESLTRCSVTALGSTLQSEEDAALKSELEMLIERLKVRSGTATLVCSGLG